MVSIVLLSICFSLQAQTISTDEEQIREVIKNFSVMWTAPNGVQIGRESSSANFMCILNQKSYNKEQYLELISNVLKSNQIQRHFHDIYKILIKDSLAYEFGLITMVMKNGFEQKSETLNIFIKEDGKWNLLSNVPVSMMKDMFE